MSAPGSSSGHVRGNEQMYEGGKETRYSFKRELEESENIRYLRILNS